MRGSSGPASRLPSTTARLPGDDNNWRKRYRTQIDSTDGEEEPSEANALKENRPAYR
jgi:hypothetical protein